LDRRGDYQSPGPSANADGANERRRRFPVPKIFKRLLTAKNRIRRGAENSARRRENLTPREIWRRVKSGAAIADIGA
jgi:hypothetical protein